jgi:hypothetical protein
MPRTILLDASVLDQIHRGNARAASALRGMVRLGDAVYIAHSAYVQRIIQGGATLAAADSHVLKQLNIRTAAPDSLEAQARSLKAEVWSFGPVAAGLKAAQECRTVPATADAPADYRVGLRLLGLPHIEISATGKVVGEWSLATEWHRRS